MRKIATLIIALFVGNTIYAQVDLKSLESVAPPASVILGNSPTNIDRPSTPQSLTTSLQSAVGSNGQFTPNINIETTPWLYRKLNSYSMYSFIHETKWINKFKQSIALSFATSQTDTVKYGNYKPGLGLAGGLRFALLSCPSKHYKDTVNYYYNKFVSTQSAYSTLQTLSGNLPQYGGSILESMKDYVRDYFQKTIQNDPANSAFYHQVINEINNYSSVDLIRNQISHLRDSLKSEILPGPKFIDSLARNPDGWKIDVNMAQYGVFQKSELKSNVLGSGAIWIVPSYRWYTPIKNDQMSIDLMFLVRYTFNGRKNNMLFVDSFNYGDLGSKIAISYKKISFNFEGIYRRNFRQLIDPVPTVTDALLKKNIYTWRITGTASYKLTDYLALQMTFGRNFDGKSVNFDKASAGSLYYNAGFNFGLTSLSNNTGSKSKSSTQ